MRALEKTRVAKRGFTLIETVIVLLLLAILLGATGFVLLVSLRAWDSGCIRGGIREDVSYAIEKVVRDLKEIANGTLSQYSSIAHTIQYDDLSGNTYVLYLYNADDATLDSTYGGSLYDLRKANITQGDNPASGEGLLILRDLVSPDATSPATALTIGYTQVTLDFVIQRSDEIVRTRTKVRPRNL
jgi:prepilin-type N-terminal cleavage/methylation domain-containing protein